MPIASGPPHAEIMIIGEAPGETEIAEGKPFVGASGHELTKMLGEAGIARSDCYLCNVTDVRPPRNEIELFFYKVAEGRAAGAPRINGRYVAPQLADGLTSLHAQIAAVRPKVIIGLGNTALWALSPKFGIRKWRGSELRYGDGPDAPVFIPTWHPAAILREWPLRPEAVQDLRRAARIHREGPQTPQWSALVRPTLADVHYAYEALMTCWEDGRKVVCDIETRNKQIACIGLATSAYEAICIPLMCVEKPDGYWTESEECAIWEMMRAAMTDPRAQFIFQNGTYDLQYFARQWGFLPRTTDDTMLMQHVLFASMRKALDYMASLYCRQYVFWKDDGKNWPTHMGESQLWEYNCEDCVRTFEVYEVLNSMLDAAGMRDQYSFQMEVFHGAVDMMLFGVARDAKRQAEVQITLAAEVARLGDWINRAVGYEVDVDSPKQIHALFYDDFGLKPILDRKTKRPTADAEALQILARRQPLIRPLTQKIEEYRSARVFKSTFADARADTDDRMRCSINLTGAGTFRWSTSEDAFGTGMNLQNLPRGTEDD